MRTKTLLLTAAALLAAGITSTQAQPVYSQNVVGYASVATPGAGVNYLITVPFAIGVSNGANEIWPLIGGNPTLPDGSTILIWNSATRAIPHTILIRRVAVAYGMMPTVTDILFSDASGRTRFLS